jgi:hypothetical protein
MVTVVLTDDFSLVKFWSLRFRERVKMYGATGIFIGVLN